MKGYKIVNICREEIVNHIFLNKANAEKVMEALEEFGKIDAKLLTTLEVDLSISGTRVQEIKGKLPFKKGYVLTKNIDAHTCKFSMVKLLKKCLGNESFYRAKEIVDSVDSVGSIYTFTEAEIEKIKSSLNFSIFKQEASNCGYFVKE